jgi:hypothetical protein
MASIFAFSEALRRLGQALRSWMESLWEMKFFDQVFQLSRKDNFAN